MLIQAHERKTDCDMLMIIVIEPFFIEKGEKKNGTTYPGTDFTEPYVLNTVDILFLLFGITH